MEKAVFQNKEISALVRKEVAKALREILDDPDFGLELTEYAKKRLHRALKSKGKGMPFSEIKKKYY